MAAPRLKSRSLKTLAGASRTASEVGLSLLVFWMLAGLIWRLTGADLDLAPEPQMGAYGALAQPAISVDRATLTSFDPFNRDVAADPDAGTNAGSSDLAPATTLNLKLMGARSVTGAPERGSAIIKAANQDQRSFKVGDSVTDGVTLAAVYRDYVELRRAGATETLFLDGINAETRGKRSGFFGGSVDSASARVPVTVPSAAPRIQRQARTQATMVSADALEALFRGINMAPKMDGNTVEGWVIAARSDASLLTPFSLEDGDLLVAVNNEPLTSAQRLQEFLAGLGQLETITLHIERDGRPISLPFAYRDQSARPS